MALRAVDPIGSNTESVSFELDRFEVDGDQGLQLRGRWFGIRGRRFVRPTLTMRIDGEKHRLLADLDHKPWAAEEGEAWVASFSPAPPAGDATDIELAVASDITVSLAPPGSGVVSATVKRPPRPASTPATPASPPARRSSSTAARASASARRAPRRKSPPDPALEQERTKAREVGRQLEGATAESARPVAESARLVAERDELTAERDRLRRERTVFRKRVRELQGQLKAAQASAADGLTETQTRLEAERSETIRVLADRDRVAAELDIIIAERDRLAGELDTVVAERDRLAAQASEAPAVGPAARERPARPASRAVAARHPGLKWVHRVLALIALCAVLLTVAVVLHLV